METINIPDGILEKRDYEELVRDLSVRLKSGFMVCLQQMQILDWCKKRLAEFPNIKIETIDAKQAADEVDKIIEETKKEVSN